jgi:hypothetical protein
MSGPGPAETASRRCPVAGHWRRSVTGVTRAVFSPIERLPVIVIAIVAILAALLPRAAFAQAAPGFTPPGPNVAQGKSYTLDPKPNYWLTQDEGDATQLTDGAYAPAEGAVHLHKQTVGWYQGKSLVTITVDLGADTPVAGMALSTGAGGGGVHWPSAILIAVSQDGAQFQVVGELTHLSTRHSLRPDAGRYAYATDDLKCHGRHMQIVMATPGTYAFCDEIEIYRGPDALLGQPATGDPLTDIPAYLAANRVPLAIRTWVAGDLYRARQELATRNAPETARTQAAKTLDAVEAENSRAIAPPGEAYRAIFPLTPAHERIFQALGALRAAEKHPGLVLWKNNRWQRHSLWDAPPTEQAADSAALQVRMLRGEHRGDAVSIANNSGKAVTARAWLEGLPGGVKPAYARLKQAEYVAMTSGVWDANALPETAIENGAWTVTLPAGISRQFWLAFHPGADVEPGDYRGALVVEAAANQQVRVPVRLTIAPFQYPAEHTLAFYMWDYTPIGEGSSYGLTPRNAAAARAHMQSYGLNMPVGGGFPSVPAEGFNAQDALVQQPDFSAFDKWVAQWPKARYYAVYMYVNVWGNKYAGAEFGTEQCDRRVGATMKAWAAHARQLGVDPGRILLHLVDESQGGEPDRQAWLFAKAVKAAVPEFKLFVTPAHADPRATGLREMFEVHDMLCPHLEKLEANPAFYEELRAGGRQLWTYVASGGPATLDAIGSYRAQEWRLWTMKGTGTGFWCYGPGGDGFTSWNTFAADTEVYSPAYVGVDRVDDGKHWLAIIEGIQDYEYLRMLRDRIAELEQGARQSPALDRARELLQALPGEALKAVSAGDQNAFDRARLQVLDALLALE